MTGLARQDPPAWVALAPVAKSLAQDIYRTEFVPQALRGNGPAVLACVMAGAEIGLGPMTSLQLIDVIQGRPALSPEGQRALVQRAGHRIVPREMTATTCTVWGQRADTGDELAVTFTIDDAERAGLAGKQNWRQYPDSMLLARATSKLCRALFADVVSGIGSYTPDEIDRGVEGPSPAGAASTESDEWEQAAPAPPPDEPVEAELVADVPPVVPPEQQLADPEARIARKDASALLRRLEALPDGQAEQLRMVWVENKWPVHPDSGKLRPTLLNEQQHLLAVTLLDEWEQQPDEQPELPDEDAEWPDPAPTAAAVDALTEGGLVDA